MAYALSRRYVLFSKLGAQILGFENIPEIYEKDPYFAPAFASCKHKEQGGFYMSEGIYLKKEKFVYLKEHIENSLLKSHMKEVSWDISELIKLLSFKKENSFGPI